MADTRLPPHKVAPAARPGAVSGPGKRVTFSLADTGITGCETTADKGHSPAKDDLLLATPRKRKQVTPDLATPTPKRTQLLDFVDHRSSSHRTQSQVPKVDPPIGRTVSSRHLPEVQKRADGFKAEMHRSKSPDLAGKEPSSHSQGSVRNVKSWDMPKSLLEASLVLNRMFQEQLSQSEDKRTMLQERLQTVIRKADELKQAARQYRDQAEIAFERQRQIISDQKEDLALLKEKKSEDLQEYDEASEYLVRIVTNLSNDVTARDSKLNRLRASLEQQTKAFTDEEEKRKRAEATLAALRADPDLNKSSLSSLQIAHGHLQLEKSDLEKYRREDKLSIENLQQDLWEAREQLRLSRRNNDQRRSSSTVERLQSSVSPLKHDSTDGDDSGSSSPLRPAGTNVPIPPASLPTSEQPRRNVPHNAGNGMRTVTQRPDGTVVFNVDDFLAETIHLPVPGPIADQLRTQIRGWKGSPIVWNVYKDSHKPSCIENRVRKRRTTWTHGVSKACHGCHEAGKLCLAWVDARKLRLLPLGGKAGKSEAGSIRWLK